jgi:hypothetical protein
MHGYNEFLRTRKLRTPYLIQRGQIKADLKPEHGFTATVKLDYMGAAEFEFGAPRRSFQAMDELSKEGDRDLSLRVVKSIKGMGSHWLRTVSALTEAEHREYEGYLQQLWADSLRTKEWTNFNDKQLITRRGSFGYTNIWWDIDNNVIFSFDSVYMRDVVRTALQVTFDNIRDPKESK